MAKKSGKDNTYYLIQRDIWHDELKKGYKVGEVTQLEPIWPIAHWLKTGVLKIVDASEEGGE